MNARRRLDGRITPLWLSHHYPEDYDRCVRVGDRHVCRRCSVLWPVTFVVLIAALAGTRWSADLDPWLLVLLPLPAVVEFVLEHLGIIDYAPSRQVALSALVGVALGVGFDRYLADQTDGWFWGVVVVYTAVCATAAWWRARTGPSAVG